MADTPALPPAAQFKPKKIRLAYKQREYFTENLALLLKAGVPLGEAFESLYNSAGSGPMRQALKQMQTDIEAGRGLADTLERVGMISGQSLALVRLGEQSGKLVDNMLLAAQQEEKKHIFRSKVRSALLYPTFVLSLTLIVGLGVAWFLLPRLADTFDQLNVQLPFISRAMIGFGTFLKQHGAIAVPAALGVGFLVGYILFGAPRTRVIGRRLLFHIPGISRMLREVEIAQFGYLLGTMLDAGLPVTQSLTLLADSSSTPQYQAFYRYLASSLEDGNSFQQSLKQYKKTNKILPPAVQQMIVAGERSGSLAEVLLTIGRTYEQKSDITTQNLEAILEPILLIIVWLGVMLVAVAVIVPIYGLLGGLNQQ